MFEKLFSPIKIRDLELKNRAFFLKSDDSVLAELLEAVDRQPA
jgi:hypothetical protein